YSLIESHDPQLDARLDELIALVAAAQEEDGYLFPARTIEPENPAPGVGRERWIHVAVGSHELYNAGHLIEAAVAHKQATGKRTLLEVATRFADRIDRDFGPKARRDIPGHEEIELALVKLADLTGESRYLDLARFFLDQRGGAHDGELYPEGTDFAIYNDRLYKQDHQAVAEQAEGVGHAVRAAYLYAGMADVAARSDTPGYLEALERIWLDVVGTKLYLTGGIGSRDTVESFGDSFELPNRTAYTETCAAIGNGLWNHRMFLSTGEARYLDVMEKTLYNGALSGVSASGDTFFYTNPLESEGGLGRSEYFDVACCPANLARLVAQVPGLIYGNRDSEIFVNLYVASTASLEVPDAGAVVLEQETRYPWDGTVRLRLTLERPAPLDIHLRIPGWARGLPTPSDLYRFAGALGDEPSIRVNGEAVPEPLARGFVMLSRTWRSGDEIVLELPMPPRRVLAHAAVVEDEGKVALQRGPIIYAVEAIDHEGGVLDLELLGDTALAAEFEPELLGGVVVIRTEAVRAGREVPLTAIPYFAWANRGDGEMVVWMREADSG
ncbi:MAG: beta-L-arabinofuranosidase domain-containing protein, partial [Thermoanaerobaculia bacterium]